MKRYQHSPQAHALVRRMQAEASEQFDDRIWRRSQSGLREHLIESLIDPSGPEKRAQEQRRTIDRMVAEWPNTTEPAHYHPAFAAMMEDFAEGLERASRTVLEGVAPPPLFAALPTGQVNGLAVVVPDTGEAVVFVETGLFRLAGAMAHTLARYASFVKH